jgi:hypothetical protein
VDSGDGTPETGVVWNSAGIDLWYRRPGAVHSSITEATQTESGAHTDGGFVHISDGYYRLDLPDAAVASGVDYVDVGGTVTGMVVMGGRIRLTDIDLDDATRGGMSALPSVAAGAAGGLPDDTDANGRVRIVDGTAAGELNTVSGTVQVDMAQTLPGSPTADTIGDALKQATREEAPKKNVALSDIPFYLVSSSDHVTPVTSATVTEEVSKDGAAFAAAAGTTTEISDGVYAFDATAADMNADVVVFKFTATGADPVVVAIATVD